MLEYKSAPFIELKAGPDDGLAEGEFIGLASVFGNIDDGGDVMVPGAFKRTLAEQGDRILLHYNHKWDDLPLGPILSIEEVGEGLKVHGRISDTVLGRDVLTLMRDKALKEMSIGYAAKDFKYEGDIRYLLDVDLFEASIVNMAMNREAVVAAVKSAYKAVCAPETDPLEEFLDDIDEALTVGETPDQKRHMVIEAVERAGELPDDVIAATWELIRSL